MTDKFRNIFLAFGIIAIIIMLCTFEMDYAELWQNLKKAGFWFPAVLLLWVLIYGMNALSWYVIICDGEHTKVSFWRVYKLTISGFALNYATPVGLMGGEPYRIMELTPYVGVNKATSSVILYVMMHIFSHFWFWLLSALAFLILMPPTDVFLLLIFCILISVCVLAIYFFLKGYKNGMAVRTLQLLTHIPFIKRWSVRFLEEKREDLERIDAQIASLHKQRESTFYMALLLELGARIVGCWEVYFILSILTTDVSFLHCIFIMAFTSLFANLFFFSPMQLGAREGGFAIATGGLAISAAFGIYTGLITRVRELIWIVIGVLLMKVGNKKVAENSEINGNG